MTSTIQLAIIGGLFSFFSTGLGALLVYVSAHLKKARQLQVSIDFAIGVMLSATAFSLIGPELLNAFETSSEMKLKSAVAGLAAGMIFIGIVQKIIHKTQSGNSKNTSHLILALALVFHNFPEGMGAGASMVGMNFHQALTVQMALSIQNVAEGLLLAVALRALGWSLQLAVFGGVLSGFVEFGGAVTAGWALDQTLGLLPFFLTFAGGAMLMSVAIELNEAYETHRIFKKQHFVWGLACIPLMNLMLSLSLS